MSMVFFLTALAALGTAVVLAARRARSFQRQRKQAWRVAADALGLQRHDAHLLSGEIDGVSVSVRDQPHVTRDGKTSSRITVDLSGHVPADLSIAGETIFSSAEALAMGGDVAVGDRTFDDLVEVHSDEAWVRAVFDADTRKRVASLVGARHIKLSRGQLVWQAQRPVTSADALVATVRMVVDVARRLSLRAEAVPGSLRRIVETDPVAGVRHAALETLLSRHAGSHHATAAARAACRDEDDAVALLGALSLGREHLPDLEWLLFDASDGSRALLEAVFVYAVDLADEAARVELVARGLSPVHERVHAVAAEAAERFQLTAVLPQLRGVVRSGGDGDPRAMAAAASAIGALADSGVEDALVALVSSEDEAVSLAAVVALGQVGSLRSVEVLLPHTRGVLVSNDIKRAARAAVESIQARHGGGEAGALTVVDESVVGAVSVVERDGAAGHGREG